jgi:hypothetical protein
LGLLAAGGFTSAIPSRGDDLTASLVKSPFRRCPLGRPAMIRWRSRRTGESGSGPTNGTDWAYAAAGRSAIRHRGGFQRMGNPDPRLHARQDQVVQTVCTKSAYEVIYHTDTPISAALAVCHVLTNRWLRNAGPVAAEQSPSTPLGVGTQGGPSRKAPRTMSARALHQLQGQVL